MINSNVRKLALSGWTLEQSPDVFYNSLYLQKFLFLYEAFCKCHKENFDFTSLKGYEHGPVFSTVWGDYKKDKNEFIDLSERMYQIRKSEIDQLKAERTSFLVQSLSENDLIELTHKYHIWSSKKDRIANKEKQVSLSADDFDDYDCQITEELESIYPEELIHNSIILPIGSKRFILPKNKAEHIKRMHLSQLNLLSHNTDLFNPVFIDEDEEGALYVD